MENGLYPAEALRKRTVPYWVVLQKKQGIIGLGKTVMIVPGIPGRLGILGMLGVIGMFGVLGTLGMPGMPPPVPIFPGKTGPPSPGLGRGITGIFPVSGGIDSEGSDSEGMDSGGIFSGGIFSEGIVSGGIVGSPEKGGSFCPGVGMGTEEVSCLFI